jgi:hypothetical protein
MLRLLALALPATLVGFKTRDYFDRELVCVHVYDPRQKLPEPLLSQPRKFGPRSVENQYFQIGLPELILCRSEIQLLEMFQYFWPVTGAEVKGLQKSVKIIYTQPVVENIQAIADLQKILEKQNNLRQRKNESLAVIFTLNDYTKSGCPPLVEVCRKNNIDELIIFKDPSAPPYLCSYPSQQKGFKRPPPIAGKRNGSRLKY